MNINYEKLTQLANCSAIELKRVYERSLALPQLVALPELVDELNRLDVFNLDPSSGSGILVCETEVQFNPIRENNPLRDGCDHLVLLEGLVKDSRRAHKDEELLSALRYCQSLFAVAFRKWGEQWLRSGEPDHPFKQFFVKT